MAAATNGLIGCPLLLGGLTGPDPADAAANARVRAWVRTVVGGCNSPPIETAAENAQLVAVSDITRQPHNPSGRGFEPHPPHQAVEQRQHLKRVCQHKNRPGPPGLMRATV